MILIIERDPIVRIDLIEAMMTERSHVSVTGTDVLEHYVGLDRPSLVFVDISFNETRRSARLSDWISKGTKVVLTNTNDDQVDLPLVKLPRPFSEEVLMSTIRPLLPE
ncbi:MAG: hypothetical protein AAGL89_09045 [Pseudomonadota bacterium]